MSEALERRLRDVGDETLKRREQQEVGVASAQFARLMASDGELAPERVQRATVSLVAALNDATTVDEPGTAEDEAQLRRLVALRMAAGDARQFAAIRQRQVSLMELAYTVTRTSDAEFGRIDVAAHLSMLDALVRYTSAWARVYSLVARRLATDGDVDLVEATLSDVLAVAHVGYGLRTSSEVHVVVVARAHPGDTVHSDAIQDLHELRRRVASDGESAQGSGSLSLERYGGRFVGAIRRLIEWYLALALSDRVLMVWTGVDALDATLPSLATTSVLVAGGNALLQWLGTSATLEPLSFAAGGQYLGAALAARQLLTPYTATKQLIKSSLAAATRYLFASPLARSAGLDALTDEQLIFALPLWQLLVVARLFFFVTERRQRARDRRRALANAPEAARFFLQRRAARSREALVAVNRAAADSAAIVDTDFGSASDEDYEQGAADAWMQ